MLKSRLNAYWIAGLDTQVLRVNSGESSFLGNAL